MKSSYERPPVQEDNWEFGTQSPIKYQITFFQSCMRGIGALLCSCFVETTIPEYHMGVFSEFGHWTKAMPAGTFSYNPCTESMELVKLKKVPDLAHGILTQHNKFVRYWSRACISPILASIKRSQS